MTKTTRTTTAAAAVELTAEQNQTRRLATFATVAADEAATRCSVGAERAASLLDAFTKLTDRESPTADAVLWALHKALCELQDDADKTAEHTGAARLALLYVDDAAQQLDQPGALSPADDQSGAALCAQDADQSSSRKEGGEQ